MVPQAKVQVASKESPNPLLLNLSRGDHKVDDIGIDGDPKSEIEGRDPRPKTQH
jgi:hypothetical protein